MVLTRRQVAGLSLGGLVLGLVGSGSQASARELGVGQGWQTGWSWTLPAGVSTVRFTGYAPLGASGWMVAGESYVFDTQGGSTGSVTVEKAMQGGQQLEVDFLRSDFDGYWNVYLDLVFADGEVTSYHFANYHQGLAQCELGTDGCGCCQWVAS